MVAALGLIAICALTQQLPPRQVTEKLVRGPVCIDQVKPGLSSFARVRGHQQVTDVYLLALARRHGARLLTFDARLRLLDEVEVLR